MPTPTSALSRIADLQKQIETLKETAIRDLKEKRVELAQQIHEVDAELASLTGKSQEPKGKFTRSRIVGRTPSFQELKDLLSAIPDRTLNLRREGLDVKHVKQLAASNVGVLKMGGRGPWPTVTLVK